MIANVREFKICAAVKLLLVKILFEEISFNYLRLVLKAGRDFRFGQARY